MSSRKRLLVVQELIENKIFLLRGKRVIFSPHLATLYEVEVRSLIQAVKRNKQRFPADFMFQLTGREYENMKSHFVISSWGGSRRARPYAFTQEGIAMLSSVLNSHRAIEVNIAIMRAFVKLRELMVKHKSLAKKIEILERKFNDHDQKIGIVFDAIRRLLEEEEKPKTPIGFHVQKE